jgi:hypothetical protein
MKLGTCEEENFYFIDSIIVRKITKYETLVRIYHRSCPNVTGGEHVCRIVPIARVEILWSFYPGFRQSLETARPVGNLVDGIRFAQERIGNPSLA